MEAVCTLNRIAESSATNIHLLGRAFRSLPDPEVSSIPGDLVVRMAPSCLILEQVYGFAGASTGSPAGVESEPIDRHWAGMMRNRKDVIHMLHSRPTLEPILCGIQERIATRFPGASLVLEGDGDKEQLYVVVETDMGVVAAQETLDAFDREWWLENAAAAEGMICVAVELV